MFSVQHSRSAETVRREWNGMDCIVLPEPFQTLRTLLFWSKLVVLNSWCYSYVPAVNFCALLFGKSVIVYPSVLYCTPTHCTHLTQRDDPKICRPVV